ncbi:Nucleotide-binding alpha-beta plait [Penicillium manginii]|jgi:hypothetical protein|uniref:Nucleotide-binding alpha-beta plait n=1 Tax=Penicillium manginii TaxID=203109 RepID=UPI002546EE57|nr:Nucleotide-binding alpha-beta plait [Penicillium manginii]KAJ5741682.1 Nucleotide-binding alpha-beta plait [Penicillium manginii]
MLVRVSKFRRLTTENREGITNVYIRGFLPDITDEMLHAYAVRFRNIERCKAIVDLDTSLCKGYLRPVSPLLHYADPSSHFSEMRICTMPSGCLHGADKLEGYGLKNQSIPY